MLSHVAKHYINNVLGYGVVELHDSPDAGVLLQDGELLKIDGRYQMHLPLSAESFVQTFGEEADELDMKQKISLLIGLIYHEMGHLISGEPNTKSKGYHIIYNIDLEKIPEEDGLDLLRKLIIAMTLYRSCLCFVYKGGEVHEFPRIHPLYDVWNDVRNLIRRSRREYSLNEDEHHAIRQSIIDDMIERLEKWWKDEEFDKETGLSLEEALEKLHPEVQPSQIICSNSGSRRLKDIVSVPESVESEVQDIIATVKEQIAESEFTESALESYLKEADKQLEASLGHGYGTIIARIYAEPWPVNKELASRLRRKIRRLTFVRRHDRRHVEYEGKKLHPANFYQIKTKPEKPKIFRDKTRLKEAPVITEFYFMMDRSGSMIGMPANICRDIMATFYEALRYDRSVRLNIAGFDTEVYEIDITNNANYVLRQIAGFLDSGGGTDYPKAMRHALRVLEKSRAEKRILIMLTDGDLASSYYDPCKLYRYAKLRNIHVLTIKLGDPLLKSQAFCDEQIALNDVSELPQLMEKISLREL